MSIDDRALQIEITIVPVKGPRGGRKADPKVPDPPRIPRIARLMALAIKFQEIVDSGEVRDYADLARLGYVTRARVTQIMNLLNLAPEIQETLLLPDSTCLHIRETQLRTVVGITDWSDQRRRWASLRSTWNTER